MQVLPDLVAIFGRRLGAAAFLHAAERCRHGGGRKRRCACGRKPKLRSARVQLDASCLPILALLARAAEHLFPAADPTFHVLLAPLQTIEQFLIDLALVELIAQPLDRQFGCLAGEFEIRRVGLFGRGRGRFDRLALAGIAPSLAGPALPELPLGLLPGPGFASGLPDCLPLAGCGLLATRRSTAAGTLAGGFAGLAGGLIGRSFAAGAVGDLLAVFARGGFAPLVGLAVAAGSPLPACLAF